MSCTGNMIACKSINLSQAFLLKSEFLLSREAELCWHPCRLWSEMTNKCNLYFQVNELQSKIKEVTRKMMAMVSELSMHQANALKLQQEVKEKESELEQCYMRMEKGEPPNEEIELEWQRSVQAVERRVMEKQAAQIVCINIHVYMYIIIIYFVQLQSTTREWYLFD